MRIPIVILLSLLLGTCQDRPTVLEQVRELGELRVVTRNSASTFYLGKAGATGFEYDLARQFARYLNVELRMYAAESFPAILPALAEGRAHIAAAGLSVTESRRERFRFGPAYQTVKQQVVYRYGHKRPRRPTDLVGADIVVVAESSHAQRLESLQKEIPELTFRASEQLEAEELIRLVAEGEIDYTVADSTDVAINKRYFPNLRVAFTLGEPDEIAWAFPKDGDGTLLHAAGEFFAKLREDERLTQIRERHFGHTGDLDYVGTRIFMRHIQQRLPAYRERFQEAAANNGIDWRLLAAIGYQESHWNPDAVSPTGVRGLMMLTLPTASDVGVDNRRDATQSIFGGARYFSLVRERIPEHIPEPDRTWMALASYNVGFYHLQDARVLTERNGGNPDRWIDVREHLPLLSQRKWYTRTRYGYARGREPVIYVRNIRSYYDILTWWTTSRNREDAEQLAELAGSAG